MPILLAVLFWCLALPCYPELFIEAGDATSYPPSSVTNTTSDAIAVNDTPSVDESKILLKFCFEFSCNTDACYCCEDQPKIHHCFRTRDQCLRACPPCSPVCPPEALPRMAIERAVMNVTL
ncbi:hypothetical protein SETIT_3G215800v2 [Setaria italica]|uniref:4Fe-4S ferredoxin-type domain-containing protein n=1 Tax=Setaria italica TaxID=4555 RepID=A0A368QHC4_SETIT|nr:hypothetical protein SETIT_3G215800v2 [Setaria italica]